MGGWAGGWGGNRRGRFGFERSLPENPALIKTSLRTGIKRTVEMNAVREKPHEAWSGWPSRLKMRAAEATRPPSVRAETRILFEGGI